jgi:HAD domain in Swiss Army Knife RNA repair proteins
MNIVFIDFDGVLNNRTSMFIRSIDKSKGLFSTDCVDLFKILLDKTNSKFVVSSSWRANGVSLFDQRNTRIHEAFETCGFDGWSRYVAYDGVTPHLHTKNRGDDIAAWLKAHDDIDQYVIIDDDSDMLEYQYKHFVQTQGERGLTYTDVCAAARCMGKKIYWNME